MTTLVLLMMGQLQFGGDAGVTLIKRLDCAGAGLNCSAVGATGFVVAGTYANIPAACSAGQAVTSNGSSLSCTSTITANDLSCSGTCVGDAEIAAVSGGKVSGAVATATALATNPTACGASQWVTDMAADGTLTCAQPGFSSISGTVTDSQLASNYSGTGACTNQLVRAVNDNAAPTCATVTIGTDTTSAYTTVEDEGTPRTQRATVNFTGSGVSCTDSGGKTVCAISSGGGGGNFVEAEVDFGAAGSDIATKVVTGQSWVTGTSVITCAPTAFATADRADGVEDALIEQLTVVVHTRVDATGFTVRAHPAQGKAFGRYLVHCTGG